MSAYVWAKPVPNPVVINRFLLSRFSIFFRRNVLFNLYNSIEKSESQKLESQAFLLKILQNTYFLIKTDSKLNSSLTIWWIYVAFAESYTTVIHHLLIWVLTLLWWVFATEILNLKHFWLLWLIRSRFLPYDGLEIKEIFYSPNQETVSSFTKI